MKKYLTILFFMLIVPPVSFATDIRGRVDTTHKYSSAPFPARGASVKLYKYYEYKKLVGSYTTGSDGMYYLPNIPPGHYKLVIKHMRFHVTVHNESPLEDLPPILLTK